MNSTEFWEWVEATKKEAEVNMPKKFEWLSHASEAGIQRAITQFYPFIWHYTYDLSEIVGRLPHSPLRTLVAQILSEELGDGNYAFCHLEMWRSFIYSMGVNKDVDVDSLIDPKVLKIISEQSNIIRNVNVDEALGLRGIIGECVCETYLKALHTNIIKNPAWHKYGNKIDNTFWDIHLNGGDEHHNQLIIQGVSNYVAGDESKLKDIEKGYIAAMDIWQRYWDTIEEVVMALEEESVGV